VKKKPSGLLSDLTVLHLTKRIALHPTTTTTLCLRVRVSVLYPQELRAMRAADKTAKALIFSSFQPTVDYLKEILPGWGYGFRFINGENCV